MEAYLSLVSAPTEVGESLTFEMAPYAFDRLFGKDCDAIVLGIVPLISLMKDQVSNLNSRRIRAYFESEGKTSVLTSSGKSPQNPLVLFHYWSVREGNAQSKNGGRLVCAGKRQNGGRNSPKVLGVPFPLQMGSIFAGRGQIISGRLANRFASQLERTLI